ncbi:MAG: phenylalanine--tRNA ligase subunit beta [Clostridiales Family XIII bacterium]|jgi:phenylalanyl-tRNA synthetase beta chain|nr:phenylalanine--tRNA ligase subunit beta [Clostridiales Family XIII bacterium]
MLVPISWLKEYVDLDGVDLEKFAEDMILSGSNIETVTTFGQELKKVVVGKLLDVVPHKDSDHLVICTVDVADLGSGEDGKGPIQIVTGADNVKPGQYVPVALHKSKIAGGVTIKRGTLRGEKSEGMLCSAQELGFDDKVVPQSCKDGIWILPDGLTVGEDIVSAIGLDETVIDFEITPNRPDCLSIIGMAREAAAVYGKKVKYPETLDADDANVDYHDGKIAANYIRVEIGKPELCNRYIARVAEDVKIEESPFWMQKRLMFSGMRPISNIVDITNYVMLETGHPIHAFDIRQVEGSVIRVDTAKEGDKFTTLDDTERTLFDDTLLINDDARGIAIAGVMGGQNSEIESDTTSILIEAASFNQDSIRRTSKKLGIRSEASARYEKGVPAELSSVASGRVCQLLRELDAANVIAGSADNYPVVSKPVSVEVRVSRVNSVLGTELTEGEMVDILNRLEMAVEKASEGVLIVKPGYFRLDIKEEIDVIEEVGRIFGYNNLKTSIHKDNIAASLSKSWRIRNLTRGILTGAGISEIQTYSFVSPEGVAKIGAGGCEEMTDFVKLINPLGEENSVMRTTLLPGILESLARNNSMSNENVSLFEIGNTFHSKGASELPREELVLALGAYGRDADFFRVKGILQRLFEGLGLAAGIDFVPESENPTFHPGRCAKVFIAGGDGEETTFLGVFGEIHPDVTESYDISERVVAASFIFDRLSELADLDRGFSELPKYPAVLRDISLVTPEEATVAEVSAVIRKAGGNILEEVSLFDVYRGEQVAESQKSLSFSLKFRDAEKTLVDEEVLGKMDKILAALGESFGAVQR